KTKISGVGAVIAAAARVEAEAALRTNFSILHLLAAAHFSRHVADLEQAQTGEPFGAFFEEIVWFSSACVLSCSAGLEAYANELFVDRSEAFSRSSTGGRRQVVGAVRAEANPGEVRHGPAAEAEAIARPRLTSDARRLCAGRSSERSYALQARVGERASDARQAVAEVGTSVRAESVPSGRRVDLPATLGYAWMHAVGSEVLL